MMKGIWFMMVIRNFMVMTFAEENPSGNWFDFRHINEGDFYICSTVISLWNAWFLTYFNKLLLNIAGKFDIRMLYNS